MFFLLEVLFFKLKLIIILKAGFNKKKNHKSIISTRNTKNKIKFEKNKIKIYNKKYIFYLY